MKSLDTNILLYAADEDCREHDAAIRLVNDALGSPVEWMLADQVLFEMYAGLRHQGLGSSPPSPPEHPRPTGNQHSSRSHPQGRELWNRTCETKTDGVVIVRRGTRDPASGGHIGRAAPGADLVRSR